MHVLTQKPAPAAALSMVLKHSLSAKVLVHPGDLGAEQVESLATGLVLVNSTARHSMFSPLFTAAAFSATSKRGEVISAQGRCHQTEEGMTASSHFFVVVCGLF